METSEQYANKGIFKGKKIRVRKENVERLKKDGTIVDKRPKEEPGDKK